MPRDIPTIKLPDAYKGETWDGLTWGIKSTDSTEFDGTLTNAKLQLKNQAGAAALTLNSTEAGEITLNNTTPRQWSITAEPRIMSLDAGIYSWALETTDDAGIVKTRMIGTLAVNADPTL
jgi:hypothetical protein